MMDVDQEWKRWILGALLPILSAFFGVKGLIQKTIALESHGAPYIVFGQEAVVISCSYLAAALFLHAYFFWENRERMAGYREVIVIVSLLCFLGCLGRFVYLDFRP